MWFTQKADYVFSYDNREVYLSMAQFDIQTLDLHGMRHEDVSSVLIDFIEENWNSNLEVEIVTGRSERMQEIVTDILVEYDLDYHIGGFLGMNAAIITTIMD